jgi:ABC-type uncharacterized transport system permease subunit
VSELALVLFWPALVGYSEAALAYFGDILRPGTRLARYAIWGVRLGWLAQTALLVAQAAAAGGFAWSTWAGSLELFVWLVVGAYLIWGCRPPFRLLGLAVMPLAAALFPIAWAAGAEDDGSKAADSLFLAFHVGLVLAAFAGFTVAAGLAALYLWQERRLKRHSPGVLQLRAPALAMLDRFSGRTIAAALVCLTLGVGVGLGRLESRGGSLDAIMGVTLLAWVVYATYLVLRHEAGWFGRRAAYIALAGFVLVLVVRIGLAPVAHF